MTVKVPTLLHAKTGTTETAIIVDPGDGSEKHGSWFTSRLFGVVGASCDVCHVRNDNIGSAAHAIDWLAAHYCEAQ